MEDCITRHEHEEFVKRMEDEHNRMNHRLNNLEEIAKEMQAMNTNIGKLATNMENILKEQQSQSKRLDAFEEEKQSGWNAIKKGIFNAIGVAVGGAVIAAILFFA